jgi:hypothetical protein
VLVLLLSAHATAAAAAKRLVVVKVDGLPHDTVERFVRRRNPRTGKSLLPWFEHVFYERGTRLANFYVRGMSMSGPSWSLLDTGQHLQVRGNVEFDRYTLHSYDYLNFIPFWVANVGGTRVDMPGPEMLDEIGIPLLVDAYPYEERFVSFQLFQRGTRWTTLQRGLQHKFVRPAGEIFSEWQIGFDARDILNHQQERELIEKLGDPRVRYLDYYSTDFDHAAHHNRDAATHLAALRELDSFLGRLWTAIRRTPEAPDTALVLVSDHGTNSDERVYSQGYNLVKWLGSAEGGGHHVVTKRRLLSDYAIKSVNPFIPLIHTTTQESLYLKGQSTTYPTALLDFDGNERAAIQLRDSDLNLVHILLLQLKRADLPAPLRRAAADALFKTIDRRRAGWQRTLAEIGEELGALGRLVERQRAVVAAQPKKWTREDADAGRDREARREFARLNSWVEDEREYAAYARSLSNLLALDRTRFNPDAVRIEELVPRGSMGDHNSLHGLQNYVAGPAPGGLALAADGTLDMERSFRRVNYFRLLGDVSVRNNVQPGIENRPVDFVAVRLQPGQLSSALRPDEQADEALWLYGGADRQALILGRGHDPLRLRYLPVSDLSQDADGRISFRRVGWRAGLPLKLWEDAGLNAPEGAAREGWLGGWHTDLEWLRVTHLTKYSNGVVGLHEQLARHHSEATNPEAEGITDDERLVRRFRRRQRVLVESDLLVLANDHWNFDVRGFNPGGNHGSFFRVSTHATMMLAGGERTGVPRGLTVEEPYDSLSFVPTLLALTGQVLLRRGFRPFPGRVIEEIFEGSDTAAPLAGGARTGDKP